MPYRPLVLLFKKKFIEAICEGRKTQTVRLWPFARMRAGQRSYIPGAGYIRVQAVDEVSLDALTDRDARRDGFNSADALRAELETLYAERLAEGYRAFRIRFEVFSASEQRAAKAERARAKCKQHK